MKRIYIYNFQNFIKDIYFLSSFEDIDDALFYIKDNTIRIRVCIYYHSTICELSLNIGEDCILEGEGWEYLTPFVFKIKDFYSQVRGFTNESGNDFNIYFDSEREMTFNTGTDNYGSVLINKDIKILKEYPYKDYDVDIFDVKMNLPSFLNWANAFFNFRGDNGVFRKVMLVFRNYQDFFVLQFGKEKACFVEFNNVNNEWNEKCFLFDVFVLKKMKKFFKNENFEYFAFYDDPKFSKSFCIKKNKLKIVSYYESEVDEYRRILNMNRGKNYIVLNKKDFTNALIYNIPYCIFIDEGVRVIFIGINKGNIIFTPHYTISRDYTFEIENKYNYTFGGYFNANYLLGEVLIHVPYDDLKIYFDEEKHTFIITDANGEYKENFVFTALEDIEPIWRRLEREMDDDD